jgi:hypothetical protein
MGIQIVRRSDSGDLAGEVKSIAVPYSGSFTSHSVTAVITKSGNLRLIDWHVDASGMVTRTADSGTQAGQVSAISIAKGEYPLYVTAVRSGSGKLLLISWNVAPNTIQRLADSGNLAGEADLIRIVPLLKSSGDPDLFLTACRSASGTLLLITWKVAPDGTFQRLATAAAGAVSEISLALFFSVSPSTDLWSPPQ